MTFQWNSDSLSKNRECFYSYYKLSRRKEPKSRKDVFPFDYSQKDQSVVNRRESHCFTSISSKWMLNQNKPMANYQNEHSTLNKGLQLYKDFYFIDNNLFETFTIETFTFATPDHYQCFQKKSRVCVRTLRVSWRNRNNMSQNDPDLIFCAAFGLARVMTDEWMVRVNGLLMKCKFLASSCSKIEFFNPAEKSLSIGEMQPKPTHLSSD